MQLISIVIPTYEEEENIKTLINQIEIQLLKKDYNYEIIVIDNCSTDNTVKLVKELIHKNKKIKLIVNNKNYGHLKSPYYAMLQTNSDATILINADFQDPPELIPQLVDKWRSGKKVVFLQKYDSEENRLMFITRKFFYNFLNLISENKLSINTTGSGIFDKKIINELKKINDPYPYFRGLVSEIASEEIDFLKFKQPKRKFGKTKNNFLTLYDLAMLALVKHSKIPLRIMTVTGFLISTISVCAAFIYLILKLLNWDNFSLGIAPILIGIFAIGGFQIFFLGIISEYILVIMNHVRNLPLVVEKERVNFD